MSSIAGLLRKAIKNQEFDKFLKGQDPYGIKPHHWVAANIPTDWTIIIPQGVYELFQTNPDLNIEEQYEDVLIQLIEGDSLADLYVAFNVIFIQLLREKDRRAPFQIDQGKIMPLLSQRLTEKRIELENSHQWLGYGESQGMWSEIRRLDGILREETGCGFL